MQNQNRVKQLFKLFLPCSILAVYFQHESMAQRPSQKNFETLARSFSETVKPILSTNCLGCHSTEKMEGDLDLERFADLETVRKEPEIWRHALEQISAGEMPPKNRKRLTVDDHSTVTGWIQDYLRTEALANAGDPGAVLVRRLTNVEYDNTIRDLTGVDLKPTREFPADGAAGEGFTNVGDALVMSPALLEKYMEAARDVSSHLVLTPTGSRFSKFNTTADWTNELLSDIRAFYRERTDPEGHTRVLLQGLEWDTNAGGRIPLAQYLTATISLRESAKVDSQTIQSLAEKEKLSPKYLARLWHEFNRPDATPLLKRIQHHWRKAQPGQVQPLAIEIQNWQKMLTKFGSVGHFKQWLGANDPVVRSVSVSKSLQIQPNQSSVELHLSSQNIISFVDSQAELQWNNPRLEKPGHPNLSLGMLPNAISELERLRKELKRTGQYLNAIDEMRLNQKKVEETAILKDQSLDLTMLQAWSKLVGYDGVSAASPAKLMLNKLTNINGSSWVNGWGSPATPSVIANSSGETMRVPGILKPHSVAVHPSPAESVVASWTSPVDATLDIETVVNDAHGDCGNGVTWSLELRKGFSRRVLAAGFADTSKPNVISPQRGIRVSRGSIVSLVIGPRNREHTCDLTEIELKLVDNADKARSWSLNADVSPDIHAGNPHADRLGNASVWSFTLEPVVADSSSGFATIPTGSKLDQWLVSEDQDSRRKLARELQSMFESGQVPPANSPDAVMIDRLRSLNGPLFSTVNFAGLSKPDSDSIKTTVGDSVFYQIPAEWAEGRTFLATVEATGQWADHDAVQVSVQQDVKSQPSAINPSGSVLSGSDSGSQQWVKAFADFRDLLPGALCYPQIVPVDEVVTVALFHREDDNLSRLLLSDAEKMHLDRLWDELWFVSQEPLKVEVGYRQFMEYVTQDGDVRVFEPLRQPIKMRADAFRKQLQDVQEPQFESVLKVVDKAWRRPLAESEKEQLRSLYQSLRKQDLPHEKALRLVLVRALLSPAFLYRLEPASDQARIRPLNDWELASRLSYFLWSSLPDERLRYLADSRQLHRPEVLSAEVQRMLADPKTRALATEFACQWLHLKDFNTLNEKSEKIFPEFLELREPMYEEVVRFFSDFFQNNRPVSDILESDRTYLNAQLAMFYDVTGVQGDDWRAVEGMKQVGRGGLLGFAALTARQAGASRTSPILRGNWLLETLLGEKLPKPPKNVPQLPESELDTDGLTMRQITEKHRADPACSKCHDRIDPFGMALESFDAIGRRRASDLAGRKVDTAVVLADGTHFEGIDGLRSYLISQRKAAFLHQFHKKLLGFALGRSVIVSDDPLLEQLDALAQTPGKGVQEAIELIVKSPQFMNQRGLQADSMTE